MDCSINVIKLKLSSKLLVQSKCRIVTLLCSDASEEDIGEKGKKQTEEAGDETEDNLQKWQQAPDPQERIGHSRAPVQRYVGGQTRTEREGEED